MKEQKTRRIMDERWEATSSLKAVTSRAKTSQEQGGVEDKAGHGKNVGRSMG